MMLSFMLGRSYDRLFHFLGTIFFSRFFLLWIRSAQSNANPTIEHHAATAITISMVVTPIKNRREHHPQESASPTASYCIIEHTFESYEDYPSSTKRISLTAPFSIAIFASWRFELPRGRVTEPGHSTTSAGEAAEPRRNSGTWVCP